MSIDSGTPPRIWRGQTLQDRTADRRELLLDAGFALLGTAGASTVTMRAVVRTAALSPRYFYENFPDRDALLFAVFDRTVEHTQQAVSTAIATAPPDARSQARAAFDAAARLFQSDPRIARVVLREALADAVLRGHARGALPPFILGVVAQLNLDGGGLADPSDLALDVVSLSGSLVSLFLDWTEGQLDVTRERLVDYCTRMVERMLT